MIFALPSPYEGDFTICLSSHICTPNRIRTGISTLRGWPPKPISKIGAYNSVCQRTYLVLRKRFELSSHWLKIRVPKPIRRPEHNLAGNRGIEPIPHDRQSRILTVGPIAHYVTPARFELATPTLTYHYSFHYQNIGSPTQEPLVTAYFVCGLDSILTILKSCKWLLILANIKTCWTLITGRTFN